VVVRGHGLGDALAVNFGVSLGRHLRVVSATELIVEAPPGRGTVDVRVAAEAGSSSLTSATRFTYRSP
jgi:hypothetical protein